MGDDPLKPGGALEGRLFEGFLRRLSETREPEPGDRIGAWRVVCELGRGGSGVVYMAERADGAFSQQVALKWLRGDRPVPGGREALARERELLASLDHPHIARLIDGGQTDDGMLWFAMDLAEGQTVDRHAANLALRDRLALVAKLCRAVHHAHRRGLIHGDIKPSNVLVDGRGEPRLVDFGISRMKGGGLGSSYGLTPDYASPEQRAGDPLTTASDIWQLGHLLTDLLADEVVATDLQSIIARATARSPDQRYASASAMATDIDAWLSDRPVLAHGGGLVYGLTCWVRRNRALSLVTATAVLVLVGGGAWMALQLAEERDLAQREAARAQAALADTQAALARAEALGDFLVNLFEATRPTRPRDQLPTTEEILSRGAERALDPESAPAVERFGMLLAIGRVYRSRNLYDDARPLIEAAVDLVETTPALRPEDHARALQLKAHLMISDGDSLDDAEALLLQAESLLDDEHESWNLLVRIRIMRTWVERHRGEHERALALVEPLYDSLYRQGKLSDTMSAALLDALAGLKGATGDQEASARMRSEAIEAYRRAHGEDSLGYAVALANSVGQERILGRFEESERRAREAIALYDRIYSDPVDYRAVARASLARTLLATGRYDEAFEAMDLASAEHAQALGNEPDRWPLRYTRRGTFLARIGKPGDALADMERADRLFREEDGFDPRLIATGRMLLAWTSCLAGDGRAGREALENLEHAETLEGNPRNRAQLAEARAACYLETGQPEPALEAIDAALEAADRPGNLLVLTGRQLLKARILKALQRHDEAAELLDQAQARFREFELHDHPRFAQVIDARAELADGRP